MMEILLHILIYNVLGCGKVDDFKDLSLDNLNSLAEEHTDYQIVCNKVYFYGYCTNCK